MERSQQVFCFFPCYSIAGIYLTENIFGPARPCLGIALAESLFCVVQRETRAPRGPCGARRDKKRIAVRAASMSEFAGTLLYVVL
jgi:hypothetical protein